ncbi:unnamed protein product [Cyclocybe aegerita]|uniref:SMP-LTD domain-containing protein n=1 Tax=Cyclocybe aegerita TaxID=1973307 RepID=A0A8S0X252_CYCAE|nr:unnamed protein product [Cyclocybe aegerita]
MLKALLYAYVLGGITFIPLLIVAALFITVYTSVPVGDFDVTKKTRGRLEADNALEEEKAPEADTPPLETNDAPRTRKGWLTMRRTFEESTGDGGYVTLVRSFLDSRSKDPKRSRPKDMWYVVLKGKVLYLYEDEEMSECEAAVELSGHQVVIYPEGLPDAELYAKRNAICLKPKVANPDTMPSVTREMRLEKDNVEETLETSTTSGKKREAQREALLEEEKKKNAAREEALDPSTPWFIFVRSNVEMEDWYFALIHASEQPTQTPTLLPLRAIFEPADMNHLVSTLDEQPDVIPMRWLNALLGRIFFSHYRTHNLEAYIIGRLMKKLSKVKRPAFLTEVEVTQVSVGNKAPMLSKPMLKELTKEGDASIEVHLQYKGEVRITVEATAVINLGARFKSYTVKLTLAAVLKELEGNLLVKVKRPPSNRIWYAFTQTPRMVLEVEPIVSDRQITWNMILSTIESKFKEIIQESVVMPNMDDIAFFDTEEYEHRGGIWSDTCRKPYVPSSASAVPDEVQSVASAPLPDTTSISSGDSIAPATKSLDEISVSSAPTIPTEGASSSTSPLDDSNDSSRNNTRRRTWFSSVRSEDLNSLAGPGFDTDNNQEKTEEHRGRTLEPEKSPTTRSHSTPSKPETRDVTPERTTNDEPESSFQKSRRSASVSQSSSVKMDAEEQDDEAMAPRTKSTPVTPRKNSDASQIARTPSPPSFFSALKSKAADKQAINTAKEAMRKWGMNVNWGGFKKEASSTSNGSGDEGSNGSPPRGGGGGLHPDSSNSTFNSLTHKARASYAEVRAAVAERKERERTPSSNFSEDGLRPASPSTPQNQRTRVTSTGGSSSKGGFLPLPNGSVYSEVPSNPSIVSSATKRLSGTFAGGGASSSTTLTPPRLANKKSTPSISKVNTEVDAQDTVISPGLAQTPSHASSSHSSHSQQTQPTIDLDTAPTQPIHVQPQAKTMSIPGIHASHRGEVQAMGYVAPPPDPPAPSSAGGAVEGVLNLKNPAIQSVYRLWKKDGAAKEGSSSTGSQQSQQGQETSPGAVSESPQSESSVDLESDPATNSSNPTASTSTSTSPPTPVPPTVKPTPPPLPPRSNPRPLSGVLVGASPAPTPIPASVPAPASTTVPESVMSPSAAEALKRVVMRDEEMRAGAVGTSEQEEGGQEGGRTDASADVGPSPAGESVAPAAPTAPSVPIPPKTPPALPPRRIQTPA